MFIRIQDQIINTDNITSIAKEQIGEKIRVNFVNGKCCSFIDITMDKIQHVLSKVDKIEGNKMRIIWSPDKKKEDRKEEIFDIIENTEVLSMIVAEV